MRKTPVGNAVFLLLKIKMKKKREADDRSQPCIYLKKKIIIHLSFMWNKNEAHGYVHVVER